MQTYGIRVISETEIPRTMRAEYIYQNKCFDSAARKFRNWCEQQGVYYYARPRETFHLAEAYQLANAAGCKLLILEDMS